MKLRGLAFFYVCILTVVARVQNGLTDEKRTVKLLGGKQTEGT